MIETAVELTEGRIGAREIQQIIDLAREMLAAEVELLDHVADTLSRLARAHRLMVITKGDLRDQELKVRSSGLAPLFTHVEIVSDKRAEDYQRILDRHAIAPSRFLMIGNSLRSDILPVLALGASAVYVPHDLTWSHEAAEAPPSDHPGFYRIAHLGELPALLGQLDREETPGRPADLQG
jgi:putative hydrolase of the HAD superfamily